MLMKGFGQWWLFIAKISGEAAGFGDSSICSSGTFSTYTEFQFSLHLPAQPIASS